MTTALKVSVCCGRWLRLKGSPIYNKIKNQRRFYGGPGGRLCKNSAPLWPPTAPSKVNKAGMLLNYVLVNMCICERCFMSIVCNFTLVLLVSL